MATPIGRAVIIIEADATKFTGDLNQKLAAEGVKAGDAAGKKTGWTFMRGVAANLVSNVLTKAAGAAGNVISSAFSLGFGRLVAIDDARGKLRGLGHDAGTVDQIMNNALASVKGTAFGLGDAATLAATAVAAGIKPGQELTRYLSLAGDAATIAGVSLSEMGSIFGKVQTQQRAYTGELNMLADRGIPIYQWLQDELGVSADALRDMVSRGEIDSATFFRVIQDNIGGAALEAGTTFSGSLENVKAAIGRLGAAFLEPIFQQMPGVFGGIIDSLDGIAPAATAVGTALGGAFTAGVGALGQLGAALAPLGGAFADLWAVVGPLAADLGRLAVGALVVGWQLFLGVVNAVVPVVVALAGFLRENEEAVRLIAAAVIGGVAAFKTYQAVVGLVAAVQAGYAAATYGAVGATYAVGAAQKLGAAIGQVYALVTTRGAVAAKLAAAAQWILNAAMRANPIGIIITLLGALVAGLVYAWNNSETFRRVVTAAWEGIKVAVGAVVGWFTDVVAPFFVGLWERIAGEGGGPNIFIQAWTGIKDFFGELWGGIVAGVTWFIDTVVGLFLRFHPLGLIITHWEPISAFFVAVWNSIVATFQGALDWIVGTFGPAFMTVARIIGLPFELGYKIMAAIAILIVRGLQALADFATGVFAAAWGLLQTYIVTPVANALAALQPIWNAITAGFTWVKDMVVAALNLLATLAIAAWNFLSTTVMAIVTALVNWVVARFNWWRDTLNAIVTVLRDWVVARWNELSSLVTAVITALVNWAVAHWTTFRDTLTRITETIRDWIVDRFNQLRTSAEATFRAMVEGIGRIWDGLKAVAAAPVRFVVETVLNDGLIAGWNWLVDKLKLPDNLTIAKIPLPAFDRGGVLPGPGTSAGDDMAVINRHGQAVATVASGEPVLSRQMYATNRAVVDSILAGKQVPGFFLGGHMPTTPGAANRHTSGYSQWAYAGDLPRPMGTPVYAWKAGEVASTMYANTSYGNRIFINHAGNQSTLYAHLSQIGVAARQMVAAGQRIGAVGSTGNSTGPHLHFEVRGGTVPIGGDSGTDTAGLMAAAMGWITERLTAPVRAAIDKIPGETMFTDAAKGTANMLLDKAVEKIGELLPTAPVMDYAAPAGSGVARWRDTVIQALGMAGLPQTDAYINAWLRQIQSESSGNPNNVQSVRDINWPHNKAVGLVQLIPGTFAAYRHPGLPNDRTHPLANLYAGMNYAKNRYGVNHLGVIGRGHGYDSGGWLMPGTTAAVNRSGRPEPVLTGGQWDNVQGILTLLERQQATETRSKRGEVNVDVTYAPVLREGDDPKRQYDQFLWDFVDDIAGVLNRG